MLQDQFLLRGGGFRRCLTDDDRSLAVPAAPVRARSTLLAFAQRLWGFVVAVKGRQALSRLAGLDDRLLADIGITRGDLSEASRELLFRDPTSRLARRARDRRQALQRSIPNDADDDIPQSLSTSKGEGDHVPLKPIYFVGC